MRKFSGPFLAVDLQEMYREQGEYEFKIALDPNVFKDARSTSLVVKDVDGRDVKVKRRDWGTKICVTMTIDGSVADGVISITVENEKAKAVYKSWCVK